MTGMHSGESLGDLLKRWRARRGFSQESLAHEAGVSKSVISWIETGRQHSAAPRNLELLADALMLSDQERQLWMTTAAADRPRGNMDERVSRLEREIVQIRSMVEQILANPPPRRAPRRS